VQIISPQGDESIATIGYPASSTPAVKTDDRKFFQIVCSFLYLESKIYLDRSLADGGSRGRGPLALKEL